jgi:hypothetical protein
MLDGDNRMMYRIAAGRRDAALMLLKHGRALPVFTAVMELQCPPARESANSGMAMTSSLQSMTDAAARKR